MQKYEIRMIKTNIDVENIKYTLIKHTKPNKLKYMLTYRCSFLIALLCFSNGANAQWSFGITSIEAFTKIWEKVEHSKLHDFCILNVKIHSKNAFIFINNAKHASYHNFKPKSVIRAQTIHG